MFEGGLIMLFSCVFVNLVIMYFHLDKINNEYDLFIEELKNGRN